MATMYSFSRDSIDGDDTKEAVDVEVEEFDVTLHGSALESLSDESDASCSSELHFLKTHEMGVQDVIEK